MNFRFTIAWIAAAVGIAGGVEAAARVAGGAIMGTATDQARAFVANTHTMIANTAASITCEVAANNYGAFSATKLPNVAYTFKNAGKNGKTTHFSSYYPQQSQANLKGDQCDG
jgi:hypothetical protein